MKTIKFGIFGLGRGSAFLNDVLSNDGELVAVCERNQTRLDDLKQYPAFKDTAFYTDFDEFINHKGMDAVFLANCFHEHTPFAIKALETGLHVLSECTSNSTMAEGVALVRAVEKSGKIYMIAENYPFMKFNQEMRRIFRSGRMGKALYCEGEYNHPIDFNDTVTHKWLRPYPEHWRNFLPRTYYITHALAPLMYITGAFPKRVTALPVFAPLDEFDYCGSSVGDRAAIITTLNDDDSVFRVTGCAAFGGHESSYRICGTKGQMENLRDGSDKLSVYYNDWEIPEGEEERQVYVPDFPEDVRMLAEKAGHGGGDFFVIREFFNAIRQGKQPEFDVYFATAMASTAILAHRSLMEFGVPYDIPDFRNENDRARYENDTATPFLGPNGSAPTIPCCSHPDYKPDPEKYKRYLELVEKE
ncbi:MAG: Gfo/Idh/MocA family oxidoreductase [Clostridia bacterium]|nr:Gfo/Idh/MocA family oxidoreductase [Clostridia bacterium]